MSIGATALFATHVLVQALAAAAEEERERKEREREEVRRKAAANTAQKEAGEAWWLQYTNKAGDKEREIAKVRARLLRFRKIAESSTAEGERENAVRLAEQAEAKLAQLTEEDLQFLFKR